MLRCPLFPPYHHLQDGHDNTRSQTSKYPPNPHTEKVISFPDFKMV